MENIELAAIITFALLGSIGHCIGMCGGFIVTYTASKISPELTRTQQALYHGLYNIGRVVAYMLLGALFGYFGSLWDITPLSRAIMFGFAGLLMILMGLSFAGKLKFLNSIEYPIAKMAWFKKIFNAQIATATLSSFFILGFLNGLIPCGLVYTMLVTATTTESVLYGAIVMGIFGIFTIPSLFTFAYIVGIFSSTSLRKIFINLAAITVIVYGAWTIMKAYKQFVIFNTPKTEIMERKACCT
ncbi:MAG: sulfite exporter TauE/SafE family protein [Helicobacteraceae bacterium]|nr:sulfite exporter TauE/SafE family protein [Helicobacteraceae bacterium]